MGSSGKTELAYKVAQGLVSVFADAQVVVKLRGGCYLYPWWIIPGLNRLLVLNSGDRAQIGSW